MIWKNREGVTMSDDMLIHFSSNSSNQSDQSLPTKIAKLEARMVGKASSAPPPPAAQSSWPSLSSSAPKFVSADLASAEPSTSSDSDDDVSPTYRCFLAFGFNSTMKCTSIFNWISSHHLIKLCWKLISQNWPNYNYLTWCFVFSFLFFNYETSAIRTVDVV